MRRKRGFIRGADKIAALAALLLPQSERDDLRARKVQAHEVNSRVEFDHIVLHALGGSDEWHNLDPKLVEVHREKSKRDTAIVAKTKRIIRKLKLARTPPPKKHRYRWPSRKIPSRKFGGTQSLRPRLAKIREAAAYSARSRSRLYQLAGQHPGLFLKDNGSTLVDLDVLDLVLDDILKPAAIKAPAAEAKTCL